MLVEFETRNFRSIREPARLSMAKGRGGELAGTNAFASGAAAPAALLRSAAVFGPNGSGKTSLVDALRAMQAIVLRSARDMQQGEPLPVAPFLLDADSRNKPSEFEATFIRDGIRYQYGFAATAARVTEEWLLAFPKGRPQRWIDRKYDRNARSDVWGPMAKLTGPRGGKALWQRATRDNALFLSTAARLNSAQLRPVYEWFARALTVLGPAGGPGGGPPPAPAELLREPPAFRAAVLALLSTADIDADDIALERAAERAAVDARFLHRLPDGSMQPLAWEHEAAGARRLFAYAAPVMRALRHGSVLVADGLHEHLHPQLLRLLVELFQSPATAAANPQLVFTTHDTSVLDRWLLRRDQIWLCERKDRSTRLFPLSDYRPLRDGEDFRRGYLSGRYGALPYVRSMGELHDVLSAGW